MCRYLVASTASQSASRLSASSPPIPFSSLSASSHSSIRHSVHQVDLVRFMATAETCYGLEVPLLSSTAASIAAAVFFFHFLISVFVAFGSASAGSKVGSAGKQRKGGRGGSSSILAVATFSTREPHPHPHRHPSREQARIHVSTFARIVAKNNMSRTNFRRKRHWPICFTHSGSGSG